MAVICAIEWVRPRKTGYTNGVVFCIHLHAFRSNLAQDKQYRFRDLRFCDHLDMQTLPVRAPMFKRRRLRGKQPSRFVQTQVYTRRRLRCKQTVKGCGLDGGTWQEAFLTAEDLCAEENGRRRSIYLVTLPHPKRSAASLGVLRSTSTLSHKDVLNMMDDIFRNPKHVDPAAAQRGTPTSRLERMVIYKEKHAPDDAGIEHPHFHVAVQLSGPVYFAPYKRALRDRHNVASHWSTSHDGYWSAVRYGFVPSPRKPQAALDQAPLPWARQGEHPSLFDSSQEPCTAAALKKRWEQKAKTAAGKGVRQPRATEMDLYAVIAEKGFRNTPDKPWAEKELLAYLQAHGGASLYQLAFRLRNKLAGFINDVWAFEEVGDELSLLGQSRWDRVLSMGKMQGQCLCNGTWRQYAEMTLAANQIDPVELCTYVSHSLYTGRCENLPVVVLMGRHGGEGKSFLLAPLENLYGPEYIQRCPQPGTFPLLGMETKRVALLDDWDFDPAIVPLSTQLLWYEGKRFPITRPQNKEYSGHLIYGGTAPVFITCKERWLGPMIKKAEWAFARGEASEYTMLMRRLKVFLFFKKLPIPVGVKIPECPACFCKMLLDYLK
jgi:hypothetical protein